MNSHSCRRHPFSLAALASSPKGEPFGTAAKLPATTKAVPLGKVASPQAMTEGVFLPVKMQCRSVHRRSGIALLKIFFPLNMRKAQRCAFPIVLQKLLLRRQELLLPLFFQDGGGALHGGSSAAQLLVSKFGTHPAVAAL